MMNSCENDIEDLPTVKAEQAAIIASHSAEAAVICAALNDTHSDLDLPALTEVVVNYGTSRDCFSMAMNLGEKVDVISLAHGVINNENVHNRSTEDFNHLRKVFPKILTDEVISEIFGGVAL